MYTKENVCIRKSNHYLNLKKNLGPGKIKTFVDANKIPSN